MVGLKHLSVGILAVPALLLFASCTTGGYFNPGSGGILNPLPGTFYGWGLTVTVNPGGGDGDLRYTTDGSDPVATSPLYSNGIVVTNQMNTVVKVRRVSTSGYGAMTTGRYVLLNSVQQINLGQGAVNVSGLGIKADGSILYVGLAGAIIRLYNPSSGTPTISPFAGTGTAGYDGDISGPNTANSRQVYSPTMMYVAANGDVYFPEYHGAPAGNRLRRVPEDQSGLYTVAGNGAYGTTNLTGTAASLVSPNAVVRDPLSGDLIVLEAGGNGTGDGNHLLRVTTGGAVSVFSGSGQRGDIGGAPSLAKFSLALGLAVLPNGDFLVGDAGFDGANYWTTGKIKRVRPDGSVHAYIGSLSGSASTPISLSNLGRMDALAVDHGGNVLWTWCYNNQIGKVAPDGTFSLIAGSSAGGAGSGGGVAFMRGACLNLPTTMVVAPNGELFAGCQDNTGLLRRFYYSASIP